MREAVQSAHGRVQGLQRLVARLPPAGHVLPLGHDLPKQVLPAVWKRAAAVSLAIASRRFIKSCPTPLHVQK